MAYILLIAPESSGMNAASGGAAAEARYHRGTVEVEVGDHLPETYGIRSRKTFWRGSGGFNWCRSSHCRNGGCLRRRSYCSWIPYISADVMTQLRRSWPSLHPLKFTSCGANNTPHLAHSKYLDSFKNFCLIVKNNSFKLPLILGYFRLSLASRSHSRLGL